MTATVALGDYTGALRAGIVAAKLGGARSGLQPLGAALGERASDAEVSGDVVTWITTPATRVRERGVDHAAVLAGGVARALRIPRLRLLDAHVARSGVDELACRRSLPGTDVVLVDDVLTTGTTAWRAGSALQVAGAGRVTLVVLARAGAHPLGAVAPRRAGRRRRAPR